MGKIKIGVIFGGQSSEHEISIMSAQSVINALNKEEYEITPIKIEKTGEWTGIENPFIFLKQFDIIFPMVHGTFGEDGKLQGLLEMADVPYIGAGVLGSALGMDKVAQKNLFRQSGLPVVDFIEILEINDNILRLVEEKIGFPCFVKPANGGSSVGISKARNSEELKSALDLARKYDNKIIAEKAVPNAREFECAVLGNKNPRTSVIGEVITSNDFYDYNAKYRDGKSQIIIPADIPAPVKDEISAMAIKAYKVINCEGMARIDFLYDNTIKELYLNEPNTIPGFTSISMFSKLWQVSGLPYQKLLDELVALGIERFNLRKLLKV
jgi:D-alanine-D-alanine ligase